MSVYFVNRSFYEGPSGRSLYRGQGDSVLECFQRCWGSGGDPNMGAGLLNWVLDRAKEEDLLVPQTMAELAAAVNECVYNPEIVFEEHCLQVLIDDESLQYAYYVFDDHFLRTVPADRAAYLLHQDWRLPTKPGLPALSEGQRFTPKVTAAPLLPVGDGMGTTWFVLQMVEESACLTEMRYPMRIEGVLLPGLCRYLAESVPAPGEPGGMDWPWELCLLRTQVPERDTADPLALWTALQRTNALDVKRIDPRGRLGWGDELEGDLASARLELAKRQARLAGGGPTQEQLFPFDPSRSLIQVDDHVAQLCLHWRPSHSLDSEMFFQWIFFDELWASAYPDLANGILHYASRWDVLSEGETP
jgi:hypothetical protein